jgi:ABC-2 type transport system ATP-binding protein
MNLKVSNLRKTYGKKVAVDGVSFEVRNGQILGLLGPNGAGKSTIIKMLSGQTNPTDGEIEIDGKVYKSIPQKLRNKVGVMPQDVIIWDLLTVKENLEFTAKLFNLKKNESEKRIGFLIEGLNLAKELNTVANKLSGGFKRRLNLAVTLMNDPTIVFLDEPTPGIDPQNRRFLWEYISNLRSENRSVVLTDHYLDEAEKLADYVVIIDNGKIIAQGTVKDLKAKYGSGNFVFVDFEKPLSENDKIMQLLKKKYPELVVLGDRVSIQTNKASEVIKDLLNTLEDNKIAFRDIQLKEPSLEDIFLILTGKDIRE